MRETSKKRIIELMKEVKYAPFPGSLPVTVGDQLPEHAFDAIAEHLVKNSITSLPHVELIEYTEKIGPYSTEKVAVLNGNHMTEEEALQYIRAEEYHPSIIIMTKKQWVQVFRDGKEM